MCNFLFVAADWELPALDWDESARGVHVRELGDNAAIVRNWLTKGFVYEIGSRHGCGCLFALDRDWLALEDEDLLNEWRESREDFRKLAEYLDHAIKLAGPVETYSGWDFWLPPLERRSITVENLVDETFIFDERQLFTVSGF